MVHSLVPGESAVTRTMDHQKFEYYSVPSTVEPAVTRTELAVTTLGSMVVNMNVTFPRHD